MSLAGPLDQLNVSGWHSGPTKVPMQLKAVHILLWPQATTIRHITHLSTTSGSSATKGLINVQGVTLHFCLVNLYISVKSIEGVIIKLINNICRDVSVTVLKRQVFKFSTLSVINVLL
ncbi:unnamed protein product [Meganyctiphanes norvegica]|uniref:Uncharacterized protein n=1 Tax=Meganyctiphanes norvegica TaxID=48144 RepID=A0AAV2QFX5_MEGNR